MKSLGETLALLEIKHITEERDLKHSQYAEVNALRKMYEALDNPELSHEELCDLKMDLRNKVQKIANNNEYKRLLDICPVKVGDVISHKSGQKMLLKRIGFSSYNEPQCLNFIGTPYKPNGELYVNKEIDFKQTELLIS
jgi:hypothetical protein